MSLAIIKDVINRVIALFIVSALTTITSSSALNAAQETVQVPLWYAAGMAGIGAVMAVLVDLAKASLDGKLTKEEVDAAFGVKPETRASQSSPPPPLDPTELTFVDDDYDV